VGLVVFIASMFGTLTQPLFGYLSDRWGSRRLIILSITWTGLAMGLAGFSWNYFSLILLVTLGALGSAAFHPAGASVALTDGQGSRRGTAVSIFSVAGNLGTALSPLWVAVGITWLGLQGTTVVMPIALLVSLFLHQQLFQQQRGFQPQSATSPAPPQADHLNRTNHKALIGLALIVMAVMCRSWFQLTLVTYLPEWIQSQGRSLAMGGQMLSVMLVSIGVGSFTGGTLSDHIGRWPVLALSLGLLAPAHWLFMMAAGPWQVILAGVMGVLMGASFPVGLVMAQEAWPRRVGVASSLVMGPGWATGGIGASVTGFLADQFSLTVGLQSLILVPLVGVVCTLTYVILQKKFLGNKQVDVSTVSVAETIKYSE
jgi:FSR family fosmidomycin resistance protein-like MFS transporter